ncbi:MAG: potassium-transporting ATPase subunit C [Nitrososphaeraceae archaeon]|jgi:potassium-transporting ATPase KdpC subunit
MHTRRSSIGQEVRDLLSRLVNPSLRELFFQNIRPSLRVIILMVLVVGIAYPIIVMIIGDYALPFQSNGSLLTLNGKLIGSKLIAQEFNSPKLFHPRSTTDSASSIDPHITPESAFSQVSNVSKATGIAKNTLVTLIELDIERNKVSNALVFAPQYVNVLEVNLDLVKNYPEHYQEFLRNIQR